MRKTERTRERIGTLLVAAGALVLLGACGGSNGGGNANPADTLGAAAPAGGAAATPAATPATPAAGAPAAAPAGAAAATGGAPGKAMAPTGKTWDVKMLGDEKGYRYEPANLTIKVGDAVRFTNVSGGPHNIAFNTVPSDPAKVQLDANMPATTSSGSAPKLGQMSSPLLIAPNDTYTISFAGVPAGAYAFNCTPHAALGMKGQFTIQ
jgi:plastocyanin